MHTEGTSKAMMTTEEFKKIGTEWTDLDTAYDNLFQAFLDNPHIKTPEEIEKFKAMQVRLYAIELELYKIAEGTMVIED
jgi:hypothetical protein